MLYFFLYSRQPHTHTTPGMHLLANAKLSIRIQFLKVLLQYILLKNSVSDSGGKI